MEDIEEKILEIVEPYLEGKGYDLVDLNIVQKKGNGSIQILTDRIEGGIKADECVRLNKEIRQLFEEDGLLTDDYSFEVSSPGLDRPLCTQKDFLRSIGKEIILFLNKPFEEKNEYQGIIKKVDDENVYIKDNDNEILIPLKVINKAEQII